MMIGNRDRLALISYFTTSLLGLQLSSTAASFSLWLKKNKFFRVWHAFIHKIYLAQ